MKKNNFKNLRGRAGVVICALLLCAVMLFAYGCNSNIIEDTTGAQSGETEARESETAAETEEQTETEAVKEYNGTLSVDVRPTPVSAVISDKGEESADASLLSPPDEYDGVFALFGFKTGEGGLPVSVSIDDALGEEEYKLKVTKQNVAVTASCGRGVFAAVSTLAQLVCDGRIAAAEIEDKPAVAYRGVIEGFYGTAWTNKFRLDLFEFMGKYKLNTYIYAPKDDPKHRSQWRSLYTSKEITVMTELVETAIKNNVRFVYAISPGLDINLKSGYEADFDKLVAKCESIYALGVRDFAILLDDIPTLDAEGHAMLCNDFQAKFVKTHEGCSNLIMITPEFCQALLTGYTNEIAPLIDPDIMIMWTGDYVLPQSITEGSLKSITKKLERSVYIWWNYPVNDTMANELFMGPCVSLGDTLHKSVSGLVSNPMNQGYASEVPLITIADYLWNPFDYDPESSVRAAVKLVEPECADGLYALMDLTRNTAINGNTSTFSLKDDIKNYKDKKDGAAKELLSKLEKMKEDLTVLSEKCGKRLYSEIKPWLEKSISYVDAAVAFLRFESAESDAERAEYAMTFIKSYSSTEKNNSVVSPDVLVPFLSEARSKINTLTGGGTVVGGKLTSTLQTYADYVPAYALDNDPATFFWTAGAPVKGSTFTVDLGRETEISGVRLLMGDDAHPDDYMRAGVIEYSSDNKNYTYLCDTTGRTTEKSASFTARYVRLRGKQAESYWLIISEFEIRAKFEFKGDSSFDGGSKVDLSPLFDGSLFTVFSPAPSNVNGKTLKLDAAESDAVKLYLTETNGLRVYTTDADGKQGEDVALSSYVEIDVKGKKFLIIEFGNVKPGIAEIVMQ